MSFNYITECTLDLHEVTTLKFDIDNAVGWINGLVLKFAPLTLGNGIVLSYCSPLDVQIDIIATW
jgi:hypothetical protein